MRVWIGVAWFCFAVGMLQAQVATNAFEIPRVYPQHRLLRQQMIQAVRSGKTENMEKICRAGVGILPLDPTWHYNLACALAYYQDKQEAFAELERAIKLGFRDVQHIRADNDLKSLSSDARFEKLMLRAGELGKQSLPGAAAPSTVVAGIPVELSLANTVFDMDSGCLHALLTFLPPGSKDGAVDGSKYSGVMAEQMQQWLAEGSASGNVGDLYVNRDGGHSAMVVSNYPGLTPITYDAVAQQNQVHMGMPNTLFSYPVLGNASLSMTTGPMWRSLPRYAMTDPWQAQTLLRFYTANQLWIFPAHRDFERNKIDHLPCNTPYCVTTGGSSHSDKPFLEAFAAVMAAFKPETKKQLILTRHLVPVMQMILRATQRGEQKLPDGYLQPFAHPVVFYEDALDIPAMVSMAQAMTPESIPPLVTLKLKAKSESVVGRDYFDLRPEILLETPFAIGCVARSMAQEQRLGIQAKLMPEHKGVALEWRVLQGDTGKIEIKPLNSSASEVEISVKYHGVYRPLNSIGIQGALHSSRVDIGCFAKTGDYYTPPAFISIFYLPNEMRVYRDDGQILSVDYTNKEHRYADPALTMQKSWKDLYTYSDDGQLIGWYRTQGSEFEHFTYLGHRVLESDRSNRPLRACAVEYLPRQSGVAGLPPSLVCADTDTHFVYSYADESDKRGTARKVSGAGAAGNKKQ